MTNEKKSKKEKEIETLKKELKEEIKKELFEENNKNCSDGFEGKVKETVVKIMDTEDNTKKYDKNDIEQNKIMAILAYFGPLSLISYFAFKESKFVQYHAKQGLNLFIIELIVGVISYFLIAIFEMPKCNFSGSECGIFAPWWLSVPIDFVQLILGIISIIGLVYACQGKAKEVPVLGKMKIIK